MGQQQEFSKNPQRKKVAHPWKGVTSSLLPPFNSITYFYPSNSLSQKRARMASSAQSGQAVWIQVHLVAPAPVRAQVPNRVVLSS